MREAWAWEDLLEEVTTTMGPGAVGGEQPGAPEAGAVAWDSGIPGLLGSGGAHAGIGHDQGAHPPRQTKNRRCKLLPLVMAAPLSAEQGTLTQGIFLTQKSNPCPSHRHWQVGVLYH